MQLLVEKTPLILLSVFSCIMTCLAAQSGMVSLERVPFDLRMINAVLSYGHYLVKTVWPYPLAYFYPHPMENYSKFFLGTSALMLGLITFLVFRFRRKAPYALMGWLWFLIVLFPMANLIQVGKAGMADRYTYLPHIGFFIMLVWLSFEYIKRWKLAAAGGVILIYAALTFSYTGHWKDAETLDRYTLKVTGRNPLVENNLQYGIVEKSIANSDVDALMKFFAQSQSVPAPENLSTDIN
jgi:protein O-mannosyl-transferase